MAGPAGSEGGGLDSLMSKSHQYEDCTCTVGESVSLTSLNWLELKLFIADSEFVKNNSGNHLYFF